jgi:hypothetical protein
MTDIVQELRSRMGQFNSYDWRMDIELRMADEIMRLRAALSRISVMEDESAEGYLGEIKAFAKQTLEHIP